MEGGTAVLLLPISARVVVIHPIHPIQPSLVWLTLLVNFTWHVIGSRDGDANARHRG